MANINSIFPLTDINFNTNSKNIQKFKEKEDKNINKNIGPYKILNKIKEGLNSKIYLAKSKYTDDEVAIKIISKKKIKDNLEDLILVSNQIESMKILKHKNIISLYEIYESPKYFYLIMEYFPKKNLIEKIILKKRLSENEALIIFIQLLDALVYIHKMNITHRNIRTEHILFDKNNRPKLIGFDYSTFYEKNKKIKGMFGSLCYTCPEILNDEEYNPELADVWSLGIVLYVMICGYLPFSDENDEKNKDLIIEGKVEYPKEISNKLKDLLKHMIEVNTSKRYSFQKIMKHPWVKKYTENKNMFIGGINVIEMKFPVDENILIIIEKNFKNFDKNEIRENLIENKYNEGTGLYKLLLEKIINMKINSVSDLFSDNFIEYIQNKENYLNNYNINDDNNNIYNKYIENISIKMTKLEIYIENYKNREEEAVDYLINIENLKKSIFKKSNNNYNELKSTISNNMNNNDELKFTLGKNKCNNNETNPTNQNDINNNEGKEEEYTDIDVIKKFREEQDNENNDNNIKHNLHQNINNNISNIINNDSINSINSESQKFIDYLLTDHEKNRSEDSFKYSINQRKTFQNNSRKSHIDRGSLLDEYLKKNHPENIRKTLLKYSLFSNISEEEGDDEKNNDKKLEENLDKDENNEEKGKIIDKSKELKYSLSFMDDGDDGDESQFNESSYISGNDTRFISVIKNALKELTNSKKEDKGKEKMKEKLLNLNMNNNYNFNELPNNKNISKKSNFKSSIINRDKNKEKNVHFSKLVGGVNKKDNINNININKNINNNIFIKENVSNFIINTRKFSEEKYNEDHNYIIFEGSDFSFHNELNENENEKKIIKIRNNDKFRHEYKNDNKNISKLNNIINNKESLSIINIDNLRKRKFLFSFKFDKVKLSRLNINNNENMIDNNFKKFIDKKNNENKKYKESKINININKSNESNNKRESDDIFDNLDKDQNTNAVKYSESILNRSNFNLQSPNINSSNNSYTSMNKNNSINNNNYFFSDNNFINEDEDSSFKIIDKINPNKDPSLDFSNIKKNYKKGNFKDNEYQDKNNNINDLIKKINILSKNLRTQKEINNKDMNKKPLKVYDNELNISYKKSPETTRNNFNFKTSASPIVKKSNFYEEKSPVIFDKLYLALTTKNENSSSIVYDRNVNKSSSTSRRCKNDRYKGLKEKVNKKNKANKSIHSERRPKYNNKNIKKMKKELNELNLYNLNNFKTINNFNEIKNNEKKKSPIKLCKKTNARNGSKENNNKRLYSNINYDLIKTQPNKKTKKNICFNNNVSCNNSPKKRHNKIENKKNNNNQNTNKKKSRVSSQKRSNKKVNRFLNIFTPIKTNYNFPKKKFNSKSKFNNTNPIKNKKEENNNVLHKKVILYKKGNNNIDNIILKRKEIVRRIRNCKKFINKLELDKKFNTTSQSNKRALSQLNNDSINSLNINNIKNNRSQKSDGNIKIEENNNSPKIQKKLLFDILSDSNILNEKSIKNDSNKNIYIENRTKTESYNNSPIRNYLVYNTNNQALYLNNDYKLDDKKFYDNNKNISPNSSFIGQENIDENYSTFKNQISNDNNKNLGCSNSSIRNSSDNTDNTFLNFEEIPFIVGKEKKINFNINKK